MLNLPLLVHDIAFHAFNHGLQVKLRRQLFFDSTLSLAQLPVAHFETFFSRNELTANLFQLTFIGALLHEALLLGLIPFSREPLLLGLKLVFELSKLTIQHLSLTIQLRFQLFLIALQLVYLTSLCVTLTHESLNLGCYSPVD